jgi:hypothetical protein
MEKLKRGMSIKNKLNSLTLGSTESSAEAPEPFRRLYFERCLQKTLMRSTFNLSFMMKLLSRVKF